MLSYQKVSDKPQVGWVSTNIVEGRLDVDFFNPEYIESNVVLIESDLQITELGKIAQLFTGPFGSRLPSSLYRSSGIPLLRVKNIGEFQIDLNDLVYLDKATHKELSNSRLVADDLALAKSGSFGNIVPIWPKYGECNITEHILGIQVTDDQVDRIYLAVFLSSRFGMSQIKQKANGTLIKYLGVATSRGIKVPIPPTEIQTYIGDKVRLAERCREEANRAKLEAEKQLDQEINFKFQPPKRDEFGVRVAPDVIGDRLTASSYNHYFLQFTELVNTSKHKFVRLGKHIKVSAMIGWKNLTTKDYVDVGVKMLRVADIKDQFVSLDETVCVSPQKVAEQPQIHLRPGDIVFSKDGTLGIAAVIPEVDELLCSGSTLARLRKKNETFDEYFLALYLNSQYTQAQISFYISGIAQPHINQEYIRKIQISLFSKEIQLALGKKVCWAEFFRDTAKNLLADAKADVEKLIEGKLDTEGIMAGRLKASTWEDVVSQIGIGSDTK